MNCRAANELIEKILTSNDKDAIFLNEELEEHQMHCNVCQDFFKEISQELKTQNIEFSTLLDRWETKADLEQFQSGLVELPFGLPPREIIRPELNTSWVWWKVALPVAACLIIGILFLSTFFTWQIPGIGAPIQMTTYISLRENPNVEFFLRGSEPSYTQNISSIPGFVFLELQSSSRATNETKGISLPNKDAIRLHTIQDDYRLVFQLKENLYLYIFRIDPKGKLSFLFPNPNLNELTNPLKSGEYIYLPDQNNWLFWEGIPGEETIYFVTSQGPREDIESPYKRFLESREGTLLPKKDFEAIIQKDNAHTFSFKLTFME